MTRNKKILLIVLVALLISAALTIWVFLPMRAKKKLTSTLKGYGLSDQQITQGFEKLGPFETIKVYRLFTSNSPEETQERYKVAMPLIAKAGWSSIISQDYSETGPI